MAVKFFEKEVESKDFSELNVFEMFKREPCEKNIYMKIPEVWLRTFEGVFPKNSILTYGHYKNAYGYIYVCDDTKVFPVKSEIQIFE